MEARELESLIDASGLSQREIAKALKGQGFNIHHSTISFYVSGRTIPDDFVSAAEPFLRSKAEERMKKIRETLGEPELAGATP